MNLFPVFLTLLFFANEEIPFKAKDEFELKLELQFRQRPADRNTVSMQYEKTNHNSGPLPYLYLHLTLMKQHPDELKIKVVDNHGRTHTSKKIDVTKKVVLDLGFTDDLKDHVSSHVYEIQFTSAEKNVVRRILVEFESDGTYLVNREKRGKI